MLVGHSRISRLCLINCARKQRLPSRRRLKLPRKWAKEVFHTLLCRDLTAIKVVDANPYVAPQVPSPFANQVAACNVTPPLIKWQSNLRGFRYLNLGVITSSDSYLRGGDFAQYHAVSSPSESEWPKESDSLFPSAHRKENFTFEVLTEVL